MIAPIRPLAGALSLVALNASAEVIYVNKSVTGGTGDGSNWTNAFTYL